MTNGKRPVYPSFLEQGGKGSGAARYVMIGILVIGSILAAASFRLLSRFSARTSPASSLLPSRDGLMSLAQCPARLKVRGASPLPTLNSP